MSLVAVQGERVDHQREAEEVEVLAGVADAVSASEPHGVVEMPVDGFGVVARGKSRSKSGSPGGMGRRFSVRFNFRAASSSLPWSRTVMVWCSYSAGSCSRCTSGSGRYSRAGSQVDAKDTALRVSARLASVKDRAGVCKYTFESRGVFKFEQ